MATLKTAYARRKIFPSFRRTRVHRDDRKILTAQEMMLFYDAIIM